MRVTAPKLRHSIAQGAALVVPHKCRVDHDPGQLAWPVKEFGRLRDAAGPPALRLPSTLCPPPGRRRRPGGGHRVDGETATVRSRYLARQTIAPAGQAGQGASIRVSLRDV